MAELQNFHAISNLKINYKKSVALNISMPKEVEQRCEKSFPFVWEKSTITYLGIKIPKILSQLYEHNHLSLLRLIPSLLLSWKVPMLSWFGRGAALKRSILPKLCFSNDPHTSSYVIFCNAQTNFFYILMERLPSTSESVPTDQT